MASDRKYRTHAVRKPDADLYGSREITPKESAIIKLVAAGYSNAAVGAELGMSLNMVKNHLSVIYDKLGMANREELAIWYLRRESAQ
jgi:DNA-binding NarL/FixJ family response regulator